MAVSATFVARFDSFFDQVSKAETKLGDFERTNKQVGDSLDRLTRAYSGDKIIADATLTARAIEQIGGASNLTDAEARKVYASLSAALDKAQRMGVEVSPGMRQLAEETGKVANETQHAGEKAGFMSESLAKLTAAFSISSLIERAGEKLYEFAASSFEAASKLTDLEGKTGVSLELLQRFQYVAAETGSDVETFAGAAFLLSKNLDANSNALKRLGLDYAAIKAMSPDEQFMAIVGALEKVTSESDRNRIGAELFGKKWAEIAPSVKEGFVQIANQAKIMGDEQIKALDAAGDRWERFKLDTGKAITGWIGNWLLARDEMSKLSAEEQQELFALQKAGVDTSEILSKKVKERAEASKQAAAQNAETAQTERNYTAELDEVIKKIATLDPSVIKQIESAKKLGVQNDELTSTFKVSETVLKVLEEQTRKQEEADKAAAEAKKKHAEEIEKLASKYAASGLGDQEKLLVEYLSQGVAVAFMSSEAQKALAKDVADLVSHYQHLGQTVPPVIQSVYDETLKLVTIPDAVKKAMKAADDEARKIQDENTARTLKKIDDLEKAQRTSDENGLKAASDVSKQLLDLYSTPYERAVTKATEWANKQLDAIKPLEKSMPEVFEQARQQIEIIYGQMVSDAGQAATKTVSWWGTALSELPSAIVNAIHGGGSIADTLGSVLSKSLFSSDGPLGSLLLKGANALGGMVGGKLGEMIGTGLADMIPGIGALIGPVIGSVFGKIGGVISGWFGSVSPEVQQARESIHDFEAGLDATLTAAQKAEAGGVGWKMTTIAVRDAYLSVGKSADEAYAVVQQLWDDKNPAASKAAMEAINKVLADQKQKYADITKQIDDLKAELTGLQDSSAVKFEDMQKIADKYGLSLSAMGPAFQKANLAQRAQEIIDDFATMQKGGADVNGVLDGMAGKISGVVNDSIKFGTTIPENMRPWIEHLIEAGELTDENGDKITDMSKINFGDPVADKFQKIADRMKEVADKIQILIDKMAGGMTSAAEDAAKRVTASFDSIPKDWNFRINGDITTSGGNDSTTVGFATGTRPSGAWFKNFGSGTSAVLHGNEAVVRRDQLGDFLAEMGGASDPAMLDELRGLRDDMSGMQTAITKAVRDGLLLAAH